MDGLANMFNVQKNQNDDTNKDVAYVATEAASREEAAADPGVLCSVCVLWALR